MKDGSGIAFARHVNAAEKGSTSDATNFLQEKQSLISAEEEHHQLWLNPPGVLFTCLLWILLFAGLSCYCNCNVCREFSSVFWRALLLHVCLCVFPLAFQLLVDFFFQLIDAVCGMLWGFFV